MIDVLCPVDQPELWARLYDTPFLISSFGRLMSPSGNIIASSPNSRGYLIARISWRGGRAKTIRVHVAVWRHFVGPIPDGQIVHHRDHDKTNPRLSNLAVCTHLENMDEARKAGRFGARSAPAKPRRKVTARTRRNIISALSAGMSIPQAQAKFKRSRSVIQRIKRASVNQVEP